ncbi:hypothetical protein BCR33DRAFT_715366 [Rhizoclosmatium globosum]|uniref:D-lactate dehydrogenase (cytochrome) n=1 Tax=Rhizoclosmatium globosum TaxID=329046 RepID=A0A1Y2CIV0_9FUNG|nr:hypothetical protein BCR33DRAFT_715366 [Rhizoclosmatium globosum]|eukprot:ORY46978.1 hypothetical protein BCR33DRAFT_715366 [Rhizoclosmatium globosum]
MSSLLRRLGSATAPLRLVTAATITKQVALAPTFSRLSVAQTNRAYSSGKKLTEEDVKVFREILKEAGPVSVLTDSADVEGFNEDWMRKFRGQSQLVLKPKTTQQVSEILKYANQRQLAVVTQGGNTGLVGGSVPVFDEIVLSTSNMNSIQSFDETAGILTCQAGCILEVLDGWLAEKGYAMPLDLGAKGTCQIGGNVATNAGGLRLLRYGSLHGTVLSMEIVKADGTIMKLGQPLRKDNTGYDLKHLFIGSEGTLGVITSVSILTPRKPTAVNVAVLALPDFAAVQKAFKLARTNLTEILSAFEFWDSACASLVLTHIANARNPFDSEAPHPFYVLIETSGSNTEHDTEKLSAYLDTLFESSVATDGVLAESETQRQQLWAFRESIPEACAKDGAGGNLKYDISVPVEQIYEIVPVMRKRLEAKGLYDAIENVGEKRTGRVVGFGHFGDGNLHLNITGAAWDKDVEDTVEPFVYEWVQSNDGSISAEHGLGVMKAPYIGYSKSPEAVAAMHEIKKMWDPKGILNPYKFLPSN